MLSEALSGLAAAGGTALVGAVATDAWHSARTGFARLLGRGEPALERVESVRLSRSHRRQASVRRLRAWPILRTTSCARPIGSPRPRRTSR